MKAEDYDVFLFLYLALLHYSITPLFQKDPEIAGITNPLWGYIKAMSFGRGFFTGSIIDDSGKTYKKRSDNT